MTPALPVTAALGWLATMVPGLRAAAILDGEGRVLGGDPALAGVAAAGDAAPAGVTVVRGASHAVAVDVAAPVLPGLLRRDLETVLHALEDPAGR
jgi:hypothetical protein